MKIKAIDIARKLGISKATVSLALNNKPGVSEYTRQKVLECQQLMQSGEISVVHPQKIQKYQMVKVLLPSKGLNIVCNAELDLWSDVNAVFDRMAKEWGYTLGLSYLDMNNISSEKINAECNIDSVAGVILFSTELDSKEMQIFKGIQKPMVIYDCDLECDDYFSVMINNRSGVKTAVNYLVKNGLRDIIYLANDITIYNYSERRFAFQEALAANNILYDDSRIVAMGRSIDEIYKNMKNWLDKNPLPQAFIMESYHLSIGAIRAFNEKNIKIPKDISLIGIDKLPSYLTGECQLTTVEVPHTERAAMTMLLLHNEILNASDFKSKIFTACKFIEGNSVKLIEK